MEKKKINTIIQQNGSYCKTKSPKTTATPESTWKQQASPHWR
jgi:hypothetical protein